MSLPDRSRTTDIIGFCLGYLPGPLEPFPSLMIDGLLSRLNHHHKNLLVFGQSFYPSLEALAGVLLSSPVDGLLFIPSWKEVNEKLAQSDLPLVAVANHAPGIASVLVDDETGAYMLAEHLALRGHRKVIFRKDPFDHDSAIRRFTAFEKAARYLGLDLIATVSPDGQKDISQEEEGYLLGPDGQRPTAVVAWADSYAQPVQKYCRAHGLSIPKDIALAGFDGILFPVEQAWKLTTIQAPWIRVAEVAVDILMCLIRGEEAPQETVLPVDLLIGDTT